MANKVLIALAVLKVNSDQGKSYIDNFIPFVAQSLINLQTPKIEFLQLQEQLKHDFGLNIPINSLKSVAKSLRKSNALTSTNNEYFKNDPVLLRYDFSQERASTLGNQEKLINALAKFAEKHGQKWDESKAENTILAYLEEKPFFVLFDHPASIFAEQAAKLTSYDRFIFGLFVKDLADRSAEELEYLKNIAKGNLLANAIFLNDPKQTGRKFRNTKVYLDSPILLYALGYAGQERKLASTEMLGLLYELGADLKCFQHTLEEIDLILETCENIFRTGSQDDGYGPSVDYFMLTGVTASDISLFRTRLERNLSQLHIRVEDKPAYSEFNEQFVIDEAGLEAFIEKELPSQKPRARKHDIESISSIMMLRKGHITANLEECRALFITKNTHLALITRQFLKGHLDRNSVPPLVTDEIITNLIWLKKPTSRPDLPTKRIIADCYAAIRPSDQLLRSYYKESMKLKDDNQISFDDYMMLRYSDEARIALMNETLGGQNTLTGENLRQVLETAKKNITAPERQAIIDLETRLRNVEAGAEDATRTHFLEMEKLRSRILSITRIIAIALQFLLGSVLLAFLGFSYFFLSQHFEGIWLILFCLAMVIAFFTQRQSIASNIEVNKRSLESRLTHFLFRLLNIPY